MKIIFIHGYTSSPSADWYPNIAPELAAKNIEYAIPSLSGGNQPHAANWIQEIHAEVEKAHGPIILVGHSLGSRAALLYLEKYPIPNLHALILVGAFNNDLENAKRRDEHYADFFTNKVDTKKIQALTKTRIIMHSMDDDSIPYQQARDMTRVLNATLLTYRDRGHFTDPESATYIFDVLQNILNMK